MGRYRQTCSETGGYIIDYYGQEQVDIFRNELYRLSRVKIHIVVRNRSLLKEISSGQTGYCIILEMG